MQTSEILTLSNNGNAKASFTWLIPQDSFFTIDPLKGMVEAGKKKDIEMTFKPQGKMKTNINEQKLTLKVFDGKNVDILCRGICDQAQCEVKNLPDKRIDFGEIPISSRQEKHVTLRNKYRTPVVFQVVQTFYKTYLQILPMKGKIPPGDSRSILFSFMCKDEMPDPGEKQIVINIRGGSPIVLGFYAKTSIPQVSII